MSCIIRAYPLQATTTQLLEVAQGARFLKVAVVTGPPQLFVLEDPSLWIQATEKRTILLYESNETGPYDPHQMVYLGTIASDRVALHCFELTGIVV